jgi:hypothetical protein
MAQLVILILVMGEGVVGAIEWAGVESFYFLYRHTTQSTDTEFY